MWQRDYKTAQDAAKNFCELFGWSTAQRDKTSISKETDCRVKRRLSEFAVAQASFREPKPGETRESMMQTAQMVVESLQVESLHPKASFLLQKHLPEKEKEKEKEQ